MRNGRLLVDIARRAEELGFSTLGTIGRDSYPTYEELVTLGAAAAVTQRIGLMTDILLAATREPVLLAKQAATLDQISGGRFILGIGAGGREDDFTVSGRGFHDRGKRLDGDLELMHKAWRGEPLPGTTHPVTPLPTNGHSVPIAFGGFAEAVIRRIVKYGVGYTLGGGTPEALAKQVTRVTEAWKGAGREGKPRFWALTYFAIGEEVAKEAEENLTGYYGEYAPRVFGAAVKTPADAKARVQAFEAVGCDEFMFFMSAPAVEQAERLAEAVL